MKTTKECIELIAAHADELRQNFGVHSLRLFGSVSRDEQHEGSDVDVCVEIRREWSVRHWAMLSWMSSM